MEISEKSDNDAAVTCSFFPVWSTDLMVVRYPKRLSWHPRNTESHCRGIWSLRAHFSLQIQGNHMAVKIWGCGVWLHGFKSLLLPSNCLKAKFFVIFTRVFFCPRMVFFSLSLVHTQIPLNTALQAELELNITYET